MAGGVTIAIPTHNRRETLLMAVRSALEQTHPPEQLIVLCDGCTDGSADAVRALGEERVQAVELPKLPHYAYEHRNRSLELARTEWIMWLGDDDLLLPDHLERIDECRRARGLEVVQTPAAVVWGDDSMSWVGLDWSVPGHLRTLHGRNTNVMTSVAVSVRAALAAGGWDGALERFGDWELWKRLMAAGARTAMTDEPTVLHFRATERDQPWPERVRQNSAWLELIGDPAELAALRPRLRRLRAEREAHWMGEIDGLSEQLAALGRERDALGEELARGRERIERLHESERTLQQIYGGGWWRLRERLSPALRLVGRLRGSRA